MQKDTRGSGGTLLLHSELLLCELDVRTLPHLLVSSTVRVLHDTTYYASSSKLSLVD